MNLKALIIDNYDSYTHILSNYVWDVSGIKPIILKNDSITIEDVKLLDFDCIIISPGPGNPSKEKDIGVCEKIIKEYKHLPILGICLGHQLLALKNGAVIDRIDRPKHGHLSKLVITKEHELLSEIDNHSDIMRYHSLAIDNNSNLNNIEVLAKSDDDDIIMAMKIKDKPHYGIQYHPESIGTEKGIKIIENFLTISESFTNTQAKKTHTLFFDSHDLNLSNIDFFDKTYKKSDFSFWLDSNREDNKISLVGEADQVLAIKDNTLFIYDIIENSKQLVKKIECIDDPYEFIREELNNINVNCPNREEFPSDFMGGLISAFTYESKKYNGYYDHNKRSQFNSFLDFDILLFKVSSFIVLDPKKGKYWTASISESEEDFLLFDNKIQKELDTNSAATPITNSLDVLTELKNNENNWVDSKEDYIKKINEIFELLRAGETYEVCLTNMYNINAEIDSFLLYKTLREKNKVEYAAYIKFGDSKILSMSPEKFVSLSDEGKIYSDPIKGTRKRGKNEKEDQALITEMIECDKVKSELFMITDLIRNDVSKVSKKGSVNVLDLRKFEKYSNVIQQSSFIEAEIDDNFDAVDLFKYLFPGGSITGAPKLRTCEIIESLEEFDRGIYTGSLGYFSYSGTMSFNICIRTVEMNCEELRLGAGGAIIIDSCPESEYEEILLKSNFFFDSLSKVNSDMLEVDKV
ncbi:chorismate-binding protein [Aquimarina algicola]|nr:chorismate-binding protein [Aquimarina algicola]